MFRSIVKSTGYPLHSPVSPSLPLPCVTVCHHILTGLYWYLKHNRSFLIYVIKTNLMHYLSSVYFVTQPLHVSGIFVTHNQEVYCIYTTTGTCCAFQLTVCWPAGQQSQLKSTTRTNCCIYAIYLLIMDNKYARNM